MGFYDPQPKRFQEIVLRENTNLPYAVDLVSREACAVRLPSFFVVGPPRTGTSWLHEVLNQHTNLPAPTKETRFFDVHFHRGLKWYQAHFRVPLPDRPSGEVAPTYFASAQARKRIAEVIPRARLIFIFRNPVQRVVSLYRTKRAYGMLPWSLEESLRHDPELIASGQYATNLREWQRIFPRNQLLITTYDDLRNNPQLFIDRVSGFLGIPQIMLMERQLKRMHSSGTMTEPRCYLATRSATILADWCKARRLDHVVAAVRDSVFMRLLLGGGAPFAEVSQETLDKIGEIFRPEVDELEEIIGRSLSEWKITKTAFSVARQKTE
jgi:sulfotransferase family protein